MNLNPIPLSICQNQLMRFKYLLHGQQGFIQQFSGLKYPKNNYLFNQNICFGYSKEPSQWDGSFKHPKYTFKLMSKIILTILR